MPAIRFPASAVPLLPLCKGHGENYVFKTYADFISFLAAYGFFISRENGIKIPQKTECADLPNSIELDTFTNRGLVGNLLIMALAHDPTRDTAGDDFALVKFIEQIASFGAGQLMDRFRGGISVSDLTKLILESGIEADKI